MNRCSSRSVRLPHSPELCSVSTTRIAKNYVTMLKITLTRKTQKGKAIHGTIVLPLEDKNGLVTEHVIDTLENADFVIPAGTYPLKMTWSPRFKKFMPLIDEVPEREGIRIHMGTKPEHSQGCILTSYLGLEYVKALLNQREKWYEEDEIEICIIDGYLPA